MTIANDCNALGAFSMVAAGIAMLPLPARRLLRLLVFAGLVTVVLNQLRLMALHCVVTHVPDHFEIFEEVVFRAMTWLALFLLIGIAAHHSLTSATPSVQPPPA